MTDRLKASLFAAAPLTNELGRQLVESFWPDTRVRTNLEAFESYFNYFRHVLELLPYPSGYVDRSQYAVQTYEDLIKLAHLVQRERDRPLHDLAETVRQQWFPSTTLSQVSRSLELVSLLWLTLSVRIGSVNLKPMLIGTEVLYWQESMSLTDLVSKTFPKTIHSQLHREARVDPGFTAVNLEGICNIQIAWTSNLSEHLLYRVRAVPSPWWQAWLASVPTERTLYIYPHKGCLLLNCVSNKIFPVEMLEETVRTLDLLFPFGDSKTRAFLESRRQPFHRTTPSFAPRTLDFGDFEYWRNRLVILHDAFNAPPSGFYQLWHDRRNPMQWWTFWLAALIAVLTLVFGVLTTYAAFEQTALAREQVRLAQLALPASVSQSG